GAGGESVNPPSSGEPRAARPPPLATSAAAARTAQTNPRRRGDERVIIGPPYAVLGHRKKSPSSTFLRDLSVFGGDGTSSGRIHSATLCRRLTHEMYGECRSTMHLGLRGWHATSS